MVAFFTKGLPFQSQVNSQDSRYFTEGLPFQPQVKSHKCRSFHWRVTLPNAGKIPRWSLISLKGYPFSRRSNPKMVAYFTGHVFRDTVTCGHEKTAVHETLSVKLSFNNVGIAHKKPLNIISTHIYISFKHSIIRKKANYQFIFIIITHKPKLYWYVTFSQ